MANKEQYAYRKANHLCVYCGDPALTRLTCDKCTAKIKGYAEARSKQFASRGKKVTEHVEETPAEFTGETVELASLSQLPKDIAYLERTSLSELASAFKAKFGTLPELVYRFKRVMGSLWIAIVKKDKDETILSTDKKE